MPNAATWGRSARDAVELELDLLESLGEEQGSLSKLLALLFGQVYAVGQEIAHDVTRTHTTNFPLGLVGLQADDVGVKLATSAESPVLTNPAHMILWDTAGGITQELPEHHPVGYTPRG